MEKINDNELVLVNIDAPIENRHYHKINHPRCNDHLFDDQNKSKAIDVLQALTAGYKPCKTCYKEYSDIIKIYQ